MKVISDVIFPWWPGKLLTPTFGNINLTETMTNLIAACKFNQKRYQNLYLHPKTFKITFKSNS